MIRVPRWCGEKVADADVHARGSCLLDVEFGILGDRSAKFWINVDIQRPPSLAWVGHDCSDRLHVHRQWQTLVCGLVRSLGKGLDVNSQWRTNRQVDWLVENQSVFAVEMSANGGYHTSSIPLNKRS